MSTALVVSVGRDPNSRRNLEVGLDTGTWGFPRQRDWYDQVDAGTFVVFGTGYEHPENNSPRKQLPEYRRGSLDIVVVARATGPITAASAPHWPDEQAESRIIYPERLPLTPLFDLTDLDLTSADPALVDAFRMSAINQGEGRLISTDDTVLHDLAQQADLADPDSLGFADSPGIDVTDVVPPVRNRRGAGRSSDAAANKATEQHAVALASAHYRDQGWDITELGKPYDLLLERPGDERHVEVKGTTGAGAAVNLTANEVRHAHQHPTDLVIVTDITLDRTTNPPTPSRGQFHLIEDWTPAPADLRVTQYEYRIPRKPSGPVT